MIYGYCRCSTNESKQDISRQKRELKDMGATDDTIFMEYRSATKNGCPVLMDLLEMVQTDDTIVITEISRIARRMRDLCNFLDIIESKCLKLVVGDSIIIDCTNRKKIDPMTKAFVQMAGISAELEVNMTQQRIQSGIKNAKSKGVKLGRPKTTISDIPQNVKNYFHQYENDKINKSDYARLCGISRPTLDKYIAILTDR